MKPILFYKTGIAFSCQGDYTQFYGRDFSNLEELEKYCKDYNMKNCWFTYNQVVYEATEAGFKSARNS
jgi:hypothetical protein